MKHIHTYEKFVPYLYFLLIIPYWFTMANQSEGLPAYVILLLAIPIIWQLFKPSRKMNFYLGLTFMCASAYLMIMFFFDYIDLMQVNTTIENVLLCSGALILGNFLMSLWIIKNSLKPEF